MKSSKGGWTAPPSPPVSRLGGSTVLERQLLLPVLTAPSGGSAVEPDGRSHRGDSAEVGEACLECRASGKERALKRRVCEEVSRNCRVHLDVMVRCDTPQLHLERKPMTTYGVRDLEEGASP